ncbi:MAG: hypothetical protein ACK4L7_02255 [Flavobacteriales bacterium]
MDQPLTPNQRLRLIEETILQAKRSFSRYSFYFLLWGFLLAGAMLANYLLDGLEPALRHGLPWALAGVVGGIMSALHGARQSKHERASNPMDRIVGWIWGGFIITLLLVLFSALKGGLDPTPAVTLLTGLPTFITGQVLRFRPLIAGGVLFWGAGIAMHFASQAWQLVALYCGAMLLGYIIPGFLLKLRENGLRTA